MHTIIIIILEVITTPFLVYALYKSYRAKLSDTQLQKMEQQMKQWGIGSIRRRSVILFIIGGILLMIGFVLASTNTFTFSEGIMLAAGFGGVGMGFYLLYLARVRVKQGAQGMVKVTILLQKSMIMLVAVIVVVNLITRGHNPYLMASLGIVVFFFLALPAYLVAHE